MSYTIKIEQKNKIFFIDVNIIREQVKFTTSVHQKLTSSGVYTQFDIFSLNTHKIGAIYALVNRCFQICWSMLHSPLILLRELFQ